MANTSELHTRTKSALAEALSAGKLTGTVRDRADELLARLQTPTRVTLMGMSQTGKSGVLNLLAGQEVVPYGSDLGTIQVRHGPIEQTTYTMGDGSTLTQKGLPDYDKATQDRPALTRVEAPLAALAKITLTELAMPPDDVGMRRALSWAAKQTDIAIWCTDTHLDREQDLWAGMPDHLKDHAILLRTRADLLQDWREEAIEAIAKTGREDFAHVMGVSALEAAQAGDSGVVDKEKLRASGAMTLIGTILRQIDKGRQNMVDQADFLLQRHAAENKSPKTVVRKVSARVAKPVHTVPTQPKPAQAAVQPTEQRRSTAKAAPTPDRSVRLNVPPVAKTQPAAATPQPSAKPVPAKVSKVSAAKPVAPEKPKADAALPTELSAAFSDAVVHLSKAGDALVKCEKASTKQVLGAGSDALIALTTQLYEDDLPDHPTLERFRTMAQDAEDLVQLLALEKNDDGAIEAVSTMLQLKRGFQAALAA